MSVLRLMGGALQISLITAQTLNTEPAPNPEGKTVGASLRGLLGSFLGVDTTLAYRTEHETWPPERMRNP